MVYLWADHSSNSPSVIDSCLYCMDMGIKSVIASNSCTNSDAGVYNMHRCDANKGI